MKLHHIPPILLLAILVVACTRPADRHVMYRITDSSSGFDVRYLDGSGILQTEKITTQSARDIWDYSFPSEDGNIVFISANYNDPQSAIKVQIFIDGKVYKQAASENDTTSFITVSGTIPIRE